MKSTHEMTQQAPLCSSVSDSGKRVGVLAYGLFAYAVGCFGLFWLILGAGAFAPVGLSHWKADSILLSIAVNVVLVALFALQHTIMARAKFKQWLTAYVPAAAERSTFILMSGLVTCVVLYFWQSVPGVVWQVKNQVAYCTLYTVYLLGILYLLLATFVTNHFELMGLRQVYLYFRKLPYTPVAFTNRFMYRYSRHPMMLGFLLLLWSVPEMSGSRFFLALLFTVYTFIGMRFEERDLRQQFGGTYRKYKAKVACFIPYIY
ncbi:isoprenylcysteine carboxylmethyltransferase family protein [Vibrio sp. B1FLJ16]|uniref:methyltransferase family protein n=1 Tax=Vibrio sp. B1FLJ16 TaxID=2751178 RepID=UPI0015F785CA|nr:isoprenylcysteine carboxylmethyltransferase family protein [Vibrio sp. B1FLJ16]CAD7818898.1 Phospholipid methyltransferase [Vibrio sp. B1FLJ16]CAD7819751.1 Phospholipid methyltransferase [Vibrio sp. B1FLJ16]CAE6936530.1 Phospholipid methyltransferase [Vibrio sp. B1FLJ16]CAE6940375.1 Phospholipid methyltransferase [Vibrio sp. B1FLJ16]